MKMMNPVYPKLVKMKRLILNATNLKELVLTDVNMSSVREDSLSLLMNFQQVARRSSKSTRWHLLLFSFKQQLHWRNSPTICNGRSLNMLILSHNNLSGDIPQCLGTFPSLQVLDLQINHFHGSIPAYFSKTNALETIKLNGNQLEGPVPQCLAHCTKLEVLDLGDNKIEDVFPNWLETLEELQVLSLRHNKFHGTITGLSTTKLRILDASNNNFNGPLPMQYFREFQGMMTVDDSSQEYMITNGSYNDSVVVIMKGQVIELARILTIFTTIDMSNNLFEGEIPHVIGVLYSLKGLNLSHNAITGKL
ncbi:Receptor-like protein [Arachis hypogaea]|nr:Receptor-like protein [Arachis hypogaea]